MEYDGSNNNPTPPRLNFLFQHVCICSPTNQLPCGQSCDSLKHYFKFDDAPYGFTEKYLFAVGMFIHAFIMTFGPINCICMVQHVLSLHACSTDIIKL